MKKRIIYFFGTVIFFTMLSLTLSFVGNDVNSTNKLSMSNLEALAGGKMVCSYSCYPLIDDCCVSCASCDAILHFNEADVKASFCTQPE